jgi:integrase
LRTKQEPLERRENLIVHGEEITAGTIRNYVKSIKLFCQMADILVPWDKITRGLPRGRRYADDRAPTLDEIKKLCDYPDRRIKSLVYTMVSSGMRVGAWDYLRWGNIVSIEQDGKIVAARFTLVKMIPMLLS